MPVCSWRKEANGASYAANAAPGKDGFVARLQPLPAPEEGAGQRSRNAARGN